jgi:hypothetical protein
MITSKYAVLSNKPIIKDVETKRSRISFGLPFWFTNWKGQKIIKVYGCSFAYLETENLVPKLSTKYANQFISVHSNIAADDTEHLESVYLETKQRPSQSETDIFVNFMMVANNYYTPKIYDLTNSTVKEIEIWFKDAYGEIVNLKLPFATPSGELEFYQALFKIEIELAIGDQK